MNAKSLWLLIFLIILVGCSQGNPATSPTEPNQLHTTEPSPPETPLNPGSQQKTDPQLITLSSGNQIKILGTAKQIFAKGKPAFLIRFETYVKIDDVPALKKEAEEIWPLFQKVVEKEGYEGAILSANEPPKGTTGGFFSFSNKRSYNFAFEKSESGAWKMIENNNQKKTKKP
jgi:hypothetical protein